MVASSWAGTPATSAWVGSASMSAFIAGSRLDASKPLRPIGTTIRSGSASATSVAWAIASTGVIRSAGPSTISPATSRRSSTASAVGDEAAHAVADHEQRQRAAALVEPGGGVGDEVGGVVALQGDATDPLGAAVGALIERVHPVSGGGESFGDVAVAAGVLAAAVEDRDDRPRFTVGDHDRSNRRSPSWAVNQPRRLVHGAQMRVLRRSRNSVSRHTPSS